MTPLALVLVLLPVAIGAAALVAFPGLVWLAGRRRPPVRFVPPAEWPRITVLLPAYNEERNIAATLDRLLELDYPADRRRIVVVSDASTDGTDAIVRGYADRGVTLVRQPERRGKSAAENAALPHTDGEVIVNTDATIRIPAGSLKPLVAAFTDPTVGVASGRDVSVGDLAAEQSAGEAGYVGLEMTLRDLETRLGTIIGASGCFYAIRRELADPTFPPDLSRDFASPLRARLLGYRSVSVPEATCLVARTASLQAEYSRKVRTMARGLRTLWHFRAALNPFVHGRFALLLWGHKVLRWLLFLTLPALPLGLLLLAASTRSVLPLLAALALLGVAALGAVVARRPGWKPGSALLSRVAFAGVSSVAGLEAWFKALRGEHQAVWEPTRRPG